MHLFLVGMDLKSGDGFERTANVSCEIGIIVQTIKIFEICDFEFRKLWRSVKSKFEDLFSHTASGGLS